MMARPYENETMTDEPLNQHSSHEDSDSAFESQNGSDGNGQNHDDSDVTVWLNKMKEEPDQSLEKIWNKYYKHLITFARKKLGNAPRRNFDEDDIVSSVLESFFDGVQQDRFPKLNDRTDLWKILLTMTARKTAQNIRSEMAEKRGGGDVRGESVFSGSSSAGIDKFQSPTEKFAEDLTFEMKERLAELGDEVLQSVAIMKLQGYTNAEIASEMEVVERTIERKLERIREIWQHQLG